MLIQLNPPLPLVTPKGKGWAHLVIDYSQEHDLLWVVFVDETGECWIFRNQDVRMQPNITLGRPAGAVNGGSGKRRATSPPGSSG